MLEDVEDHVVCSYLYHEDETNSLDLKRQLSCLKADQSL